ncbi:cysteine-rich receptor-like protein kinase 10 [Phragmites australis]|uniref:cysteine-rich receptor-like protein kinase 10 n=1 Tax=Phragmites australis TaxID=29695 RepID=UPI002D77BB28|nr:cysteine-rich receptor-like protein kinase 10 [Phragmites australis]
MAMAAHHHSHLPSYLAAVAILFIAFILAPPATGDSLDQLCGTSGNYTVNSTYQANIQRLATTLPKSASSSRMLFANATLGAVPDIVYALALCRGDTNASACGDCVTTAFQDVQQLCAYNKDPRAPPRPRRSLRTPRSASSLGEVVDLKDGI